MSFISVSCARSYPEDNRRYKAVENSDQEVKVVHRIQKESALEKWVKFWKVGMPRCLNKKWQEHFLAIQSDSPCVKIRCQDTTSDD